MPTKTTADRSLTLSTRAGLASDYRGRNPRERVGFIAADFVTESEARKAILASQPFGHWVESLAVEPHYEGSGTVVIYILGYSHS